jgi:hypothetical protein
MSESQLLSMITWLRIPYIEVHCILIVEICYKSEENSVTGVFKPYYKINVLYFIH